MRSVKKVLLFVAAVCVMHGVQACTGGPDPEDPGLNPQPLPPVDQPAPPQDGRDKNSDTTGAMGGGSTSSGSSSGGGSSGGSSGLPATAPDGGDAGSDGGDN